MPSVEPNAELKFWPWDGDLSWEQKSDAQPAEPPRHPKLLILLFHIIPKLIALGYSRKRNNVIWNGKCWNIQSNKSVIDTTNSDLPYAYILIFPLMCLNRFLFWLLLTTPPSTPNTPMDLTKFKKIAWNVGHNCQI